MQKTMNPKDQPNKRISIKVIAALNAIAALFLLTIVIMFIGYHLFEKNVMEKYEKYATTVLAYAHSVAEDYSFGDMIGRREMPAEYEEMRLALNKIKENSDIEYLYAIYFDNIYDSGSLTYAINTKTAEELANGGHYTYLGTPCEEGSFEEETIQVLRDAVMNKQTEVAVLDGHSDEYGHMLNGYKVLFDSRGNAVGLMCVEIDINNISTELNRYVKAVGLFVACFTIVLTAIYLYSIDRFLINPITGITSAANEFIENIGDQKAMEESVENLRQLDIRSKSEIADLYKTVTQMETDIARQLNDIRQYAEHTLKMQNGLMVLMADMVEVRDSDTGPTSRRPPPM